MHNDYEIIRSDYKVASVTRSPAPHKPVASLKSTGTLYAHSDVEGVPFVLNPNLSKNNQAFEVFAYYIHFNRNEIMNEFNCNLCLCLYLLPLLDEVPRSNIKSYRRRGQPQIRISSGTSNSMCQQSEAIATKMNRKIQPIH